MDSKDHIDLVVSLAGRLEELMNAVSSKVALQMTIERNCLGFEPGYVGADLGHLARRFMARIIGAHRDRSDRSWGALTQVAAVDADDAEPDAYVSGSKLFLVALDQSSRRLSSSFRSRARASMSSCHASAVTFNRSVACDIGAKKGGSIGSVREEVLDFAGGMRLKGALP